MDELISTALEELALEGRSGCTVPQLWQLLEQKLPISNITQLGPEIKHYLWRCLIQRTEDLQLFRETALPPAASAAQPSIVAPVRKGRKVKVEVQPTSQRVPVSSSEVSTYQAAEATDVRLLASDAVRMGVLGLYDALHCRFALSEPQLKTLEMIARKRTLGVLQSVLASQMQITNSNFFYVVKCLEERGLIARTPIMVTNQRSNATVLTTNVLHLQRFAPAVRLGPYQVFKMVDAPGGQQQLDMDTATYTIQDDARLMRLICERIGSTEDRSVIESELKVVLGFSGKRGHRTWRRLRAKLIKAGQIESFAAEVNGKTLMCLRLLKDFHVPGEDGDDDDATDDKRDTGALMVEVSVERQVLEAILATGEEGVLNTQLFSQLGLNHKRSGALLSELVKKYGLTVTVVTVNKAIHNRIQAPRHLLEQYQRGNALLALGPGEGPLLLMPAPAGICTAVKVQQESVLLPLPPIPTATQDGPSPTLLDGSIVPRSHSHALKSIAATRPGAESLPLMSASVTPGSGDQRGRSITPEPGMSTQAQPTYRAMRPQRVTTDLSDDRLRRLFERLDEHGYIVAYEIRGLLYRHEVEKGVLPPSSSLYQKGPDKKTINRLLARMEATGRAKQITITVPGSYTNGELRTMHVVVPSSFQPTDEKVKEIQEYFIGIERRARSASTKSYFAARAAILQSASPRASSASPGPPLADAPSGIKLLTGPPQEGEATPAVKPVAAVDAGGVQQPPARLRLGSLSQPVSRLLPEGTNMRAVRAELALQEGSKRGVGALSHKQLFGSSPVSLRSLTQIIKPGLGVVERMPDNMAVLMGGAYQGEAVYSRMLLNGFNWCKMARARLLHYFICRCVGLGGFQQVPADQQDMANHGHAGSLPYYGPSLHVALQSCKPPPPPGPEAAKAAAGPTGTYTITGRQLWAAFPIGLALQVMGSSHEVPDLLALCQANTPLGDLTPAQLDRVFDKSAHKRFSKLLGLLQQLQLLTVTSTATAGARPGAVTAAKSGEQELVATGMDHVTFYHVTSKGWMEQPAIPAEPTPAAAADAEATDAAADTRPSKRRRGKTPSPSPLKDEGAAEPMQGQEVGDVGQDQPAAGTSTQANHQQQQGEGDMIQAGSGSEVERPKPTRGARGRQRGRGRGRGRGRPKGKVRVDAEPQQPGAGAAAVRVELDLHTAAGLEEYWQKLETTFGKTTSSRLAAQCFPATVVPELMAPPLWSNLRTRVSTVTWLHLAAAVHDMLGGTTELDRDSLSQLAHEHGVERQVVNRIVHEHLKRQLSAAGVRGRLSQHVRRAATTGQGRGPGRRAAAGVGEEGGRAGTARKRTREAQRVARRARKAEKQQERLQAARQTRARELARLQSHQALVLSQLQANQQALSIASGKLAELESAMQKAEEGYTDVVTSQQQSVEFQQVKREVQVKSQEEMRLKEQLKKLQATVLQLQAAAAAADKAAAAEAEAQAQAAGKQLRKKKTQGRDAETDGEASSGGDTSDGEDLAGSEAEGDGEDEEMGEEGEGPAGGGVLEGALGAVPLRMRRGRQFFTRADDEALLRAWITLRVDKGMEYSTAAGRLPWLEMRGLPATRKACYSRMALINKKYRTHMDDIVAAIRSAHAKLVEARCSAEQAADATPVKEYLGDGKAATGTQDAPGAEVQPSPAADAAHIDHLPAAAAGGTSSTATAGAAAAAVAGVPSNAPVSEPGAVPGEGAVAAPPLCAEELRQLVEEIMKGHVAALLAAMPERQTGSGAGGSHAGAPLRVLVEQQGMRRPALLATGLFGKSLIEVTRQARDSLPAATHHVSALTRGSALGAGPQDHTALSPGTLCAMQLICSLLVMQTWQVRGSGSHASQGVAEGAQALARRFSESDLRAALLALRVGGWLSSGVGGSNAWQLSPQFHNHLEGNVEIRRARALGQGAQLLAGVLTQKRMAAAGAAGAAGAACGAQQTSPAGAVNKASSTALNAGGLQGTEGMAANAAAGIQAAGIAAAMIPPAGTAAGAAAATQAAGTAAAAQAAGTAAGTAAGVTRAAGVRGLAQSSSAVAHAPATIVGGQMLVTQTARGMSTAASNAQLVAVREQLVDLCPDLFSSSGPSTPASSTDTAVVEEQQRQQGATALQQPQLQLQQQQEQSTLQLHTGAPDVDVPSELLMIILPCLATTHMRLAVQRVGTASEEVAFQPQQGLSTATGGLSLPLTLTLTAGDKLDKVFQPSPLPAAFKDLVLQPSSTQPVTAAQNEVSSMESVRAGDGQQFEESLHASKQLAVSISSEPSYMLSLPSGLMSTMPGCHSAYATGQQPALRTSAEEICTQHLQLLTDQLQSEGMLSEQQTALCRQAAQPVLSAIRSSGQQGSSLVALQAVLDTTVSDMADTLQQKLPGTAGWGPGADVRTCVLAVLAAVLLRAGLVRVIAAFNHTRLAAVECSQHLVAVPSTRAAMAAAAIESASVSAATTAATDHTTGQASTASGGTPAVAVHGKQHVPAREVLLAPWHDCRGYVNSVYLQALVQRAVLAVERAPGSSEHSLEEALNMVCPTHARQLLRAMADQGLLRVRTAQPASMVGVAQRPSLLGGRQKRPEVAERHYIPVLLAGLPQRAAQLQMNGLIKQ